MTIVSGVLFGTAGDVLGTRSCPDGECTVEDLQSQIFGSLLRVEESAEEPKEEVQFDEDMEAIDAHDIADRYAANEVEANRAFMHKKIAISGIVFGIKDY